MGKRRQRIIASQERSEPKQHTDRWPIVLRDQIEAAGLPVPFREHVFHASRNWRCDLAWPDRRQAVEVDGAVHRIKGRFKGDIEKHNALTLAGYRWLRVTPAQVRDGEALKLVRELLR
jgi:very-short-patch-repair endonuclease